MIKDKENALAGARCIIQNWLEAKESEVIHFITDESHKKEADWQPLNAELFRR